MEAVFNMQLFIFSFIFCTASSHLLVATALVVCGLPSFLYLLQLLDFHVTFSEGKTNLHSTSYLTSTILFFRRQIKNGTHLFFADPLVFGKALCHIHSRKNMWGELLVCLLNFIKRKVEKKMYS